MEPWLSWTTLSVLAAGGYLYYSGKTPQDILGSLQGGKEQPVSSKHSQDKQSGRRKAGPANKTTPLNQTSDAQYSVGSSSSSSAPKVAEKRKPKASTATAPAPAWPSSVEPDEVDEGYGDKELAKELEARMRGITLNKTGPYNNTKTLSNKGQGKNQMSNGATPSIQPEQETGKQEERGAGGVSDMLPPLAPGPSTLRIIGHEPSKKKQTVGRVDPPKESKKQRQNRRKVEEEKAQREEDEKRRQLLLEQQRRTAREARGEPAKNGIPANKPHTSVWASEAQAGSVLESSGPATAPILANNTTQLLDTFDHDATSTTSSNGNHTNVTTPATIASTTYDQELPSEEAQLEMLTEGDNWNEVSSKKKKTKTKAPAPVSPRGTSPTREDDYPAATTKQAPKNKTRATPAAPVLPAKSNGYAALEQGSHPDDSEWAA